MLEGLAAIVRDGHHNAVSIVPDGIESAVRAHDAVEAFESAVVVAREAGCAVKPDRLRPALALIGGAREQKLTSGESELGPADIEISGIRAHGVSKDVRLVLKWNSGRGIMRDDGGGVGIPSLTAVGRAANEDAVARCAMRPVLAGAQL